MILSLLAEKNSHAKIVINAVVNTSLLIKVKSYHAFRNVFIQVWESINL